MSANSRQEGGDHYKTSGSTPQHWDLAILYSWDIFQYQITKYVMRWRNKHDTPEKRLLDLKKARHFLDKYIENFEGYDSGIRYLPEEAPTPPFPDLYPEKPTIIPPDDPRQGMVLRPVDMAHILDHHQDSNWMCEGYYGDLSQLYRCRHCRTLIRSGSLSAATDFHGACASPGYVNQG